MICGAYTECLHVWHLRAVLIYIGGTRNGKEVMKSDHIN